MKKINWKIFHLALWTEIVLAYFLPFRIRNNFEYQAGFPMSFICVYDTKLGKNLFMSMHVNPIGLLFDILIIYLIILVCVKAYQKFKHNLVK
ncbi:MAG: hypothetical protein HFG54_04150 [Lachnospiraceae bacterium]|jgi:hypothetical protein|nr:hypothetical protein [Lachnospiraceae bacterium]